MQLVTLALSVLIGASEFAQQGHQHPLGKLGTVKFPNSCAAAAQPDFARGMALLHSFEFGPASDAMAAALKADPGCGIALWATALAHWGNPFSPAIKPPAPMKAGRATVERATAAGAKTQRERDYITAVGALYDRFETVSQRDRTIAYRNAMAQLATKYPDDPEATAFYALSIAAAADPADKSYVDLLKAGAMLEALWRTQPDHPGLAHYIIHSYDVPALAARAAAAARRYATIAPDAPHALHMPSHTFTRVGQWQDSIEANSLSAVAAHKIGSLYEELHATDYQVYAYLQTGQDIAARRLVNLAADRIASGAKNVTIGAAPASAGDYALAAIPARYALERGDWAAAARLETRPSSTAYADALTWFGRALGASRLRDTATARAAVEGLQKEISRLTEQKEPYWSEQAAIQEKGAEAWLALAENRNKEALALMREAADREDRTEKAAITPGPLAPARELLGEMLLELKEPKAALAEFQKTIAKEPNRFRALAGAATAASQSGDRAAARQLYAQLLTVCSRGDTPGRSQLEAARLAVRNP